MKTFYAALTFFFLFGAVLASPLDLAADSPERTLACCPTTKSKNPAISPDVPVRVGVVKPKRC
ncbi:uncharacterized protein N7500_001386 [Penicillium coprophilum]|uniref:uncharacterized protein n=1 Tax=Penicillium coprophilum TaxID=36646 RepID=UPI002382C670|nr:uncharacterized protein N7500_001386 [Penicillium coprophilum]KAJ5173455.1 hypothetical protein N7500_001386 [Penicillium coprophilum]